MEVTTQSTESPVESQIDHLFLAFTNTDLESREAFDAWTAQLDALTGAEAVWGERFAADPDQRPGNAPTWKFMAVFGLNGEATARDALAKLEKASNGGSADFAVWAYEAVADFVRQSDGLPGTKGKIKLAPGAYRNHE